MRKARGLGRVGGLLLMLPSLVLRPAGAVGEGGKAAQVPGFQELAAQAAKAREDGELVRAMELYQKAVEKNLSWTEGWWYLATLSYDMDLYEQGRDAFRQVVNQEPDSAPAWSLLGLCEFQTREYDRALASLQKGRKVGLPLGSQLSFVASYHTALLMIREGSFELAIDGLQKLALNKTEHPKLIEAFGLSVLRLPFLPAEAPPDRREAILLAGQAANFWAINRLPDAGDHYKELVDRYPALPNAHYARGVFMLLEDPDEAVAEFRRELEISPEHVPARLQLAFEYIKRGEPEQGLPFAEDAVSKEPGSFAARNALGRIYLALDRIDDAVRELERGVELAPGSPEMYFSLARAYTKAGRQEDSRWAREEFRRLEKLRRELTEGPPANRAGQPIPTQEGEEQP